MTVAAGTVWVGGRLLSRWNAHARRLVDRIDYRLVLLGGLVPDLIDKPVGWVIWRDHFDANGHLYGHTILAAVIVLIPGIVMAMRRQDPTVISVGLAMLCHLAVDPTNHSPESLLWPLFGTDFPKISLLGTKATVITEAISFFLLLAGAISLQRGQRLGRLVSEGHID